MKILVCYGTRPEAIKLAPVVRRLIDSETLQFTTLFTEQHLDLDTEIYPHDYVGGGYKTAGNPLSVAIQKRHPDMVVVQGDTRSAFQCAVEAYQQCIPVAHVEAGLRTGHLYDPWPEEGYRRMIDSISTLRFYPHVNNVCGDDKDPIVTGNTVVDALRSELPGGRPAYDENLVIVTVHRRESWGIMHNLMTILNELASDWPSATFLFPMHPAPAVQKHRELLVEPNIQIVSPLNRKSMICELLRCRMVLTDSGGLMEEAPILGKRVVVIRERTERPELVDCGAAVCAGVSRDGIRAAFCDVYESPTFSGKYPYGDGRAAERIVSSIERYFDV